MRLLLSFGKLRNLVAPSILINAHHANVGVFPRGCLCTKKAQLTVFQRPQHNREQKAKSKINAYHKAINRVVSY